MPSRRSNRGGGLLAANQAPGDLLDKAAIATMATPVVGDVLGLLADSRAFYREPTVGNAVGGLLGALPFVPAAAVRQMALPLRGGRGLLRPTNSINVKAYHGSTEKGLKEIDPKKAIETEGAVFFADNPDVADTFTVPREYGEPVWDVDPGDVYERNLSIENPMMLSGKEAQDFIDDTALQAKLVKKAKEQGYDGIVATDVLEGIGERYRGNVYAVFSKEQIK